MRRAALVLAILGLLTVTALPASAGPIASCGATRSGWTLATYVPAPYEGWETTGLWTTWTGWVEEEGFFQASGLDAFGAYVYLEGGAAAVDVNADSRVCMKLATPVPTEQPSLVSPWWFDWDIFLLDNVRGPKT